MSGSLGKTSMLPSAISRGVSLASSSEDRTVTILLSFVSYFSKLLRKGVTFVLMNFKVDIMSAQFVDGWSLLIDLTFFVLSLFCEL